MRFRCSWVLSLPLGMTLVACSGSFGAGQASDAGGYDATDENPAVQGMGGADSAGAHDGTTVDAGHDDATAAAETGTTEGGGEGGTVAEAGDEGPPPGCGTGDIECSGACVPSDVHNCGTCGHDCTNLAHVAGATSCTAAGACSFPATACAAGWADCNGKPDDGCETDITKPGTCGSCTNVCTANAPVCAGGTCVSGCPVAAPKLCSGTCVDTTSNANDCNGCGLACPNTVQNSQPTCVSSACTFTCNGNFTGCPTVAPTACVDEVHDATNCGKCNKTCPGPLVGMGQAACVAGACTLNCSAGLTACPVVGPTECANTTTDLSNCGSCGDVCGPAPANAHPTCVASMCGFACDPGFQLCNGTSCVPVADGTNGVFVSPSGSGSACTETAPCSSVQAGTVAAKNAGKTIVYLDKGTYSEQVVLGYTATFTIKGGWTFSAGNWTTCNNGLNSSSIITAPAGSYEAIIFGSGTWTLDTLSIAEPNTPPATTATGASPTAYGIFAPGMIVADLMLKNVAIQVAGGGPGTAGAPGTPGAAPPASCTDNPACTGLVPGASGSTGAAGLQGAYGNGFVALSGGQGSSGSWGCNGTPGGAGNSHASCGLAADGDGCGSHTILSGAGNPGCGGGPGFGSFGGTGGGASIGVYVNGPASVTFVGGSIQTGAGGVGGQGSSGAAGASGSLGTAGSLGGYSSGCVNTPTGCHPGGSPPCGCSLGTSSYVAGGTAGGPGASGGKSGAGGGGAGGDSLCYVLDTSGGVVTGSPTCTPGAGGVGGLDGNGSAAAQGATGRSGTHN